MERPQFSQREAAAACGVSLSTIRRKREAGGMPNASRDPVRGWLIPVEDLLASGFRVNAPAPPDEPTDQTPPGTGDRADLERQLVAAQHARTLAEVEARHLRDQLAARDRHLEDVRQALRALTPGPADTSGDVPQQHEPGASSEREPEHSRRWGLFRRG